MITALAIIGWLAFAATAYIFWLRTRLSGDPLAMFILAMAFSDEFRATVQADLQGAIEATRQKLGHNPKQTVSGLMEEMKAAARKCYEPGAEVSSTSTVRAAVRAIEKDMRENL